VSSIRTRSEELREQLRARVELLATVQADALATALWDFDDDKALAQFAALELDPDLAHARLLDPAGEIRWHRGRRPPAASDLRVRRAIVRRQDEEPVPLGELELFVSTARVEAAVRSAVERRVLLLALVLASVLGTIVVGFRHVGRHLDRIAAVVARLGRGEHGVPVPGVERADEIGAVARAMEALRLTVQEAERLRGDEARASRAALARIRAAVESSGDPIVILEPNGAPAFVNGAAERLLGPLDGRGAGRGGLARLILDPRRRRELVRALSGSGAYMAELEVRARGGPLPVELRVDRILAPDGALAGFVAIGNDVSERRATERRIRHLAHHDPLTDLPNRTLFRERVEQAAAASLRSGGRVALMLVDLDRFKEVNDSLGHPAGDALLCAAAGRLRRIAPPDALVARLGGDEFALLLPTLSDDASLTGIAERIVRALAEPFALAGRSVRSGATIGVAILPDHARSPDGLLQHADLALYRAKAEGRGRLRLFDPEIARELREGRELEADLHDAIAAGQLHLVYQPRVEIATGRRVGAEALLRWNHPRRGPIAPASFVPLAEERGLIVPIGAWVLEAAAAQAASWARLGGPPRVSVNLSPVQFREVDLAGLLAATIARHGLTADRLEVEITEGVLLQDTPGVLATLDRIRALGVGVALDDFGTGYASLSYLRKFRLDRLKLDRSFVCDLEADGSARAVARTVVELGHSLGMRVTAEGVETPGQLACLRALGCDEAQGFLTGRPVAADALATAEPARRPPRVRRPAVAARARSPACGVSSRPP
jgi:diguanylate cyclase (GGDEF)-like protein/PAS domain S-box-containing protein